MATSKSNLPESPIVDARGYVTIPWLIWLQRPTFQTVDVGGAIPVGSGGTGTTASPTVGQILASPASGSWAPATTLPAAAFPALAGDLTTSLGSTSTTLATVNGTPGAYGTGNSVPVVTVNAKGLVTGSASTAITGAPGSFTAVGGFGCNAKAAQTSAAVNAAVAGAAGVLYTATEQTMLNDLKALVNQLRAALVANGIAV